MPWLDNRTLAFAACAVALAAGMAMSLLSLAQRRAAGPPHWAGGAVMLALAMLLMALPHTLAQPAFRVAANLLLAGGLVLVSRGVYRFLGLAPRNGLHLACLAFTGLFFLHFVMFHPHESRRALFVALVAPALVLDMAWTLIRRGQGLRPWVARAVALGFAMQGLGALFWGGYAFWRGDLDGFVADSPATALLYVMLIMTLVGQHLGLQMLHSLRLEDELAASLAEVKDEVRARRATERKLVHQATHDYLTGLANRRSFFQMAAKEVARARRQGQPLSLIMLDLDHFKDVNDTHGHRAGDLVLKKLAQVCLSQLRAEDTLARFGGEEFVILLPQVDLSDAAQAAQRLRRLVESMVVEDNGQHVRVTASFGVAELEPGENYLEEALRRADQALYWAKRSGRNQTWLHPGHQGLEPQPALAA